MMQTENILYSLWRVGWCDGTSSAGASCNWTTAGQGPTALAVGAGGGCVDIFTLIYPFFLPFFGKRPLNGLKYCLKGRLNPKPTKCIYISSTQIQVSYERLQGWTDGVIFGCFLWV